MLLVMHKMHYSGTPFGLCLSNASRGLARRPLASRGRAAGEGLIHHANGEWRIGPWMAMA